jgi:hypothetical protein
MKTPEKLYLRNVNELTRLPVFEPFIFDGVKWVSEIDGYDVPFNWLITKEQAIAYFEATYQKVRKRLVDEQMNITEQLSTIQGIHEKFNL